MTIMNTDLQELYEEIRQREPLRPESVKPGMRVGIIYPTHTTLISVAATGPAGGPVITAQNRWFFER